MVVIGHLEPTDGGRGASACVWLTSRDFTANLGLRREKQDAVQKSVRQARAGVRCCERLLESPGHSPFAGAHLARRVNLSPSFHPHTSLQLIILQHGGRKPRTGQGAGV